MKLHVINVENFKLDGGASFGVVPKSIWVKTVPVDENNLINVCNRLLLVETGDHKILIDSGIGNKQDEKYLSHFQITGNTLEQGLAEKGFSSNDITDVIFTHLHFDHVGGCVKYNNDRSKLSLVFPKANHYCSKEQWDWANDPNPREKASYHTENYLPLFESGHLEFIHEEQELFDGIFLKMYNGHTQGQIIPEIEYNGRKVAFMADFIASVSHIPVPYVPSFDVQPLLTLKEKTAFYERALAENIVLFFEHDYYNECCTVQMTEKGIKLKDIFKLSELNIEKI
ncbi:MAG: MBL fold metallo-hydrolase [Bacteroidales bacterium]|jgi:glyoxylase-like metal-dependent hydrolase (beta-lactamase superfamily II)